MKNRYKTKSAVMLLLVKKQNEKLEVLLQKRQNTGYADGYWDFSASGHVELEESMKTTVVRETMEETGVSIKIEDIQFMYMEHKRVEYDNSYYNGYFFTEKWEGEPKIAEPEKCEKIEWFPIEELPDNMIPDRKRAIENYLKQNYYGEYGWNEEKQ